MFWQDLDVLLNFSPDSLSLFLTLHDVSLSLCLWFARALSLFPVLLLLSSSNSCIVPHPLWGHTISSLGSSRGNTFCVRSALEELITISSGFSSSFLLYPAPCREIFSCLSSVFIPSLSQHAGLNCCPGWTLVGGSSLSPVSVLLLLWWGELFYFHRSMKILYKLLNCHISVESSRFYVFLSWRKK